MPQVLQNPLHVLARIFKHKYLQTTKSTLILIRDLHYKGFLKFEGFEFEFYFIFVFLILKIFFGILKEY